MRSKIKNAMPTVITVGVVLAVIGALFWAVVSYWGSTRMLEPGSG